jgi:hypothetical protein
MSSGSAGFLGFLIGGFIGFFVGIGVLSSTLPDWPFNKLDEPNILRLECREGTVQFLTEKNNDERQWLMTGLQCKIKQDD